MATRFGTTVITSSLFDNENVVLATIIKFNQVTGVIVILNENEIFSKELNEKIGRIKAIFIKNKKVDDIIKVLKVSNKDKLGIFDKIFFLPSNNITKQQMAEYVKKEVFKSIIDVDVIEKKVDMPDFPMDVKPIPPMIEDDDEMYEAAEDTPIDETCDEVDTFLDSIPDEPIDGDKDLGDEETLEEIKDQVE